MEKQKKKMSTRTKVLIGLMSAITIIMAYTPLGLIPLQPISATITHLPTVIISILEGPIVGAIVGGVFGVVTLIRAATSPTGILDPYFVNPLVSVLPRILIGAFAGLSYMVLKKILKKELPSVAISSAIGSATNTICVMGMIYVLYAKDLTEVLGTSAGMVIWGIITSYGIMEMLAILIISTIVVMALKKIIYK